MGSCTPYEIYEIAALKQYIWPNPQYYVIIRIVLKWEIQLVSVLFIGLPPDDLDFRKVDLSKDHREAQSQLLNWKMVDRKDAGDQHVSIRWNSKSNWETFFLASERAGENAQSL